MYKWKFTEDDKRECRYYINAERFDKWYDYITFYEFDDEMVEYLLNFVYIKYSFDETYRRYYPIMEHFIRCQKIDKRYIKGFFNGFLINHLYSLLYNNSIKGITNNSEIIYIIYDGLNNNSVRCKSFTYKELILLYLYGKINISVIRYFSREMFIIPQKHNLLEIYNLMKSDIINNNNDNNNRLNHINIILDNFIVDRYGK